MCRQGGGRHRCAAGRPSPSPSPSPSRRPRRPPAGPVRPGPDGPDVRPPAPSRRAGRPPVIPCNTDVPDGRRRAADLGGRRAAAPPRTCGKLDDLGAVPDGVPDGRRRGRLAGRRAVRADLGGPLPGRYGPGPTGPMCGRADLGGRHRCAAGRRAGRPSRRPGGRRYRSPKIPAAPATRVPRRPENSRRPRHARRPSPTCRRPRRAPASAF